MTEDQVFAILLAAIMCLMTVLIVVAARNGKDKKTTPRSGARPGPKTPVRPASGSNPKAPVRPAPNPKPKTATKSQLMGSLARKPVSLRQEQGRTGEEPWKPIDASYAESHGQWVCPYCETLNGNDLGLCQACGQPRDHT